MTTAAAPDGTSDLPLVSTRIYDADADAHARACVALPHRPHSPHAALLD